MTMRSRTHRRRAVAGAPGAAIALPDPPGWRRGWLALLLATMVAAVVGAADAAADSKIYRTVDEDGNVVFTDVPPREGQSGEAVDLDPGSSYTPPPRATPPAGNGNISLEDWLAGRSPEDAQAEDEDAGTAVDYQSLSITSPANDAAVRENAGNVVVSTAIEPSLGAGHVMQVYVDGQLRQQGHTTTFQLVNLDRGSHSVQVRVVDPTGTTLIASEPSVFHLQRRSVILQPNNRAR